MDIIAYQCDDEPVRLWWLIPEVVLCTAILLIAPPRPSLRHELASRATSILEQRGPQAHHGGGEVVCAAETMGYEPAEATRPEQVAVVYVYFLCASGEEDMPWDFASRIAGPAAIRMTEPPQVHIAEAGAGYPERVRSFIPAELLSHAFGGFRDPALPAQVRSHYR